jgi:hypothetical protein
MLRVGVIVVCDIVTRQIFGISFLEYIRHSAVDPLQDLVLVSYENLQPRLLVNHHLLRSHPSASKYCTEDILDLREGRA